jgi:hypothetical protein
MKLMTKAIEKAAQKQFPYGNDWDKQKIVAKFFDPCGSWTWYLMNQDPKDPDYLWGIVNGFAVECGSFSLSELEGTKTRFGLGIERDKYFTPISVKELWDKLQKGIHV